MKAVDRFSAVNILSVNLERQLVVVLVYCNLPSEAWEPEALTLTFVFNSFSLIMDFLSFTQHASLCQGHLCRGFFCGLLCWRMWMIILPLTTDVFKPQSLTVKQCIYGKVLVSDGNTMVLWQVQDLHTHVPWYLPYPSNTYYKREIHSIIMPCLKTW